MIYDELCGEIYDEVIKFNIFKQYLENYDVDLPKLRVETLDFCSQTVDGRDADYMARIAAAKPKIYFATLIKSKILGELVKIKKRQDLLEKWQASGILDGLHQGVNTNIVALMESQSEQSITENRSAEFYWDTVRLPLVRSVLIDSLIKEAEHDQEEKV